MEYGINHAEELIEAMEIIDLSEDTRVDYFTCLEEWSDEANPPRWIRAKKNLELVPPSCILLFVLIKLKSIFEVDS